MARPAASPLFGALIAAAASLYTAAQTSRPLPARQSATPPQPSRAKLLANAWAELGRDHISIMAAGVAFYGLLAIFPGMSALISLYGLAADPGIIEQQLSALAGVLPQEALKLISDQLHALIAAPPAKLGIGLVVSLAVTLWSAMSGTGALMQALTVAYEEQDNRSLLAFYAQALLLTIGIALFGLISLLLVAVVPAVIGRLPISPSWQDRVSLVRWPILAGLVLLALTLLYRFAPARIRPYWDWLRPGTVAAALLWMVGSAGFSFYVEHFGSYDKTYGSLGAVVVLLMWFYVTGYIVLFGAELNCEFAKARRHR